jgi:hypothetical protein
MKYNQLGIQNTKVIKLIVDEKYSLLRHAVLLFGLLVVIFYSNWLSEYTGVYKYYRLLCVYSTLIGMFYINKNVLMSQGTDRSRREKAAPHPDDALGYDPRDASHRQGNRLRLGGKERHGLGDHWWAYKLEGIDPFRGTFDVLDH